MSALGYYVWQGQTPTPATPWQPDPGPGDVPVEAPDQPGSQGEDICVAFCHFPVAGTPIPLYGAKADIAIKAFELGPNTATITVPTDPVNMRILGVQDADTDVAGRHVYSVDDAVSWEFLVGSNLTGQTLARFTVRGEVAVDDAVLTANCVGIVGGVTADRIIGAPERKNLLDDASGGGSWESGDLNGWTVHGDNTVAVAVHGGIDGNYKIGVKGTPDAFHYIERRVRYTQPPHPWGRQRIAGTVYPELPIGFDIDDYGLITVGVEGTDGTVLWPPGGIDGTDPEAGIVTSDMVRGEFTHDPVVGIGYLPTPPFTVDVCVRLHPVDETAQVFYDDAQLIRRENRSTVVAKDLTVHPKDLFDHFQHGMSKSSWAVSVEPGTPVGISDISTWWFEDGQSAGEALTALTGRGFDLFDAAGPGRRVISTKRRGAKRTDLPIHEWDLLGVVSFKIDPGAMRSAVRATSSANTVFAGADVGAIDTTYTVGQVIDVVVAAPVGMNPKRLREWANQQLGSLKLVQCTATLLVPWRLGRRISVGDSLTVAGLSGSAAVQGWFRVQQWAPDFDGGFVAIDVGKIPAAAA